MSETAKKLKDLDPLKRAVVAMNALRTKLNQAQAKLSGPIAIVGLGCRLPGGIDGPDSFWQALLDKKDATGPRPANRWSDDSGSVKDEHDHLLATNRGGFLEQIDGFDAALFGISNKEALSLDPQQRMLLEVSWEALEHAGIPPDSLRHSKMGVFTGIGIDDYIDRTLRSGEPSRMDAYSGTGIGLCFASGRISYVLGTHGPSLSLDTACSSSMVAIHLACDSLRKGESDLALAGGVNLMMSPEPAIFLSQAQALSPDGTCKTFDASANGYSRAEGCAVLAFKRLADAEKDGNHIFAVIRGSALNHDGPSSGLTVPNNQAQIQVLASALENAAVQAHEVEYVEAHGTGTALGDPIELRALQAVYGKNREATNPLRVASVKTNIGHLETGASAVSVMKAALALHHQTIPAQLHFNQPTPHFNWDQHAIEVPTQAIPWLRSQTRKRFAGVSAFGLSGTNGHLILEEAPERTAPKNEDVSASHYLLKLSAKNPKALGDLAQRYSKYLTNNHPALADFCANANLGRSNLEHRASVVATNHDELSTGLQAVANLQTHSAVSIGQQPADGTGKLVFLFSGQGAQYSGMGREWYAQNPVFRKTLDACAGILAELEPEFHLLDVLFHPQDDCKSLVNTRFTQPALFSLEVSLFEMWKSLGLEPDAVMGHSLGEFVAAYAAGVFDLVTGLKLVHARGRLMHKLAGKYGMLAVRAGREAVATYLEAWPEINIASLNSPYQTVVAGPQKALTELKLHLETLQIKAQILAVSHGFHSEQMDGLKTRLPGVFSQFTLNKPTTLLIGNQTARPVGEELLDPNYWFWHARNPVRFSESLDYLMDQGYRHFLEIGPKPVLLPLAKEHRQAEHHQWYASCHPKRGIWPSFLKTLGQLYTQGFDIQWSAMHSGSFQPMNLPTYPFQHKRFWLERPRTKQAFSAKADRPLLDGSQMQQFGGKLGLTQQEHIIFQRVLEKIEHQQALDGLAKLPELALNYDWLPFHFRDPHGINENGTVLILGEDTHFSQNLVEALMHHCHKVVLENGAIAKPNTWASPHSGQIAIETYLKEQFPDKPPAHIVSLWGLRTHQFNVQNAHLQALAFTSLLNAITALGWASETQLHCLAKGAMPTGATQADLSQAALWASFMSLKHQASNSLGTFLDLCPSATADPNSLAQLLFNTTAEDLIALRHSKALVPRLKALKREGDDVLSCNKEASYLITGGTGALGLATAHSLVLAGATSLYLLSRNQPGEKASQTIQSWREQGVTVVWASVDLSDSLALKQWFTQQNLSQLKGVFHTAGISGFHPSERLTAADWEQVFKAKVHGAWYLHQLTQELSLDHFVMFGSVAAIYGSKHQAHYAAANACLNGLAHLRMQHHLPATCLAWGPWSGGGLADDQALQLMERMGIQPFSPKQGQALVRTWAPKQGIFALAHINWVQLKNRLEQERAIPLLSTLGKTTDIEANTHQSSTPSIAVDLELLRHESLELAGDHCLEYLRAGFSELLALPPEELQTTVNIAQLGLDSLMVADLRSKLRRDLGCAPSHAQLMRDMSLGALADVVLQDFRKQFAASEVATVGSGPNTAWQEGEL